MEITEHDKAVAALTIWGEARGAGYDGMAAVAWVIMHRAANPRWWGGPSLQSVCQKRIGRYGQFSCWNLDDPQARKLTLMMPDAKAHAALAWKVLDDVLAGRVPDPTGGSTHYCTPVAARTAQWARARKPHVKRPEHWFYRPQDLGETPITPWRAPALAPTPEGAQEVIDTPTSFPSLLGALWLIVVHMFKRKAP